MLTGSPLVLVVDDEYHMRTALYRILAKEGYRVIMAPDGRTALRLTEVNKPDVIVLDIMMPGIDGREVCQKVRGLSATSHIIYFTAKADPVDPLKLKELRNEADAFIAKPATSKKILSGLSRVLQEATK